MSIMINQVAIASEHAGYELKEYLKKHLMEMGYTVTDTGAQSSEPTDYPDIAAELSIAVAGGMYDKGILICGTGIGMSIAAGKVPGIRAALCTDAFMSKMSVKHNNANILCLGGWITGTRLSAEITMAFLEAEFEGGRHERRITRIAEIEADFRHRAASRGGGHE